MEEQKLSNFVRLATGKDVHVTSNKNLNKDITSMFPDIPLTDGKRVFLPDLEKLTEQEEFEEHKRMCLEKTTEIENGYFSRPKEDRPQFENYKFPNIAASVYQVLENEKIKSETADNHNFLYKLREEKNFLEKFKPVIKKINAIDTGKILKNAFKYSVIAKRGKARHSTTDLYTDRIYSIIERNIDDKKIKKRQLKKLFPGFNGDFFSGNCQYTQLEESEKERTQIIKQSGEELETEYGKEDRQALAEMMYNEIIQEKKLPNKYDLIAKLKQELDKDEIENDLQEFLKGHSSEYGAAIQFIKPRKGTDCTYDEIKQTNAKFILQLQKEFEKLKPESDRRIRRQVSGDEIDVEAGLNFMMDLRTNTMPDERVYENKTKNNRDVQLGILVDQSGSMSSRIDYARETAIVFSEALEKIGDTYSIFGFDSGHGHVRIMPIKGPNDKLNEKTKSKYIGMTSAGRTDEGPAIRFVTDYIMKTPHKTNILLHISDARPNNRDDTRKALLEAKQKGVRTYCLSLVNHGEDQFRRIYGDSSYGICEDMKKLPQVASEFYKKIAF